MTKVISVFSQKGGVGKSTVSVLLANLFFFQSDFKVAIIDADYPQRSIFKRRQRELEIIKNDERLKKIFDNTYKDRIPYPIIPADIANCKETIRQLRNTGDFDFIFVDAHKRFALDGMDGFLSEVSYFLIPAFLDDFSLKAAVGFYALLENEIKPNSDHFINSYLFFNKVPGQSKIDKTMNDLENKFNLLSQFIANHILYERSYRSTTFPIPIKTKEGYRLKLFVEHFLAAINETSNPL